MFEHPNQRESAEKNPAEEEIRVVFDQYLEGAPFTESEKLSDKDGIYSWQREFQKDGARTVVWYQRKGKFPTGHRAADTAVSVIFYDGDMPVGGDVIRQW